MDKKEKILYLVMFIFILNSCASSIPEKSKELPQKNTYNESKTQNENTIVQSDTKEEKLKINSKCIWCWKCCMIDKTHFKANFDIWKAEVTSQDNLESEKVSKAIEICPVDAISIS